MTLSIGFASFMQKEWVQNVSNQRQFHEVKRRFCGKKVYLTEKLPWVY